MSTREKLRDFLKRRRSDDFPDNLPQSFKLNDVTLTDQ